MQNIQDLNSPSDPQSPDLEILPVFRPAISDLEIDAVVDTLRSRWLGPGPRVKEFEAAFAIFTGARYAISTNSGTAALLSVLVALGVGAGDQVIIPSFTFISAFQMITLLGAEPVFADVDSEFLLIDPEDVRQKITPATKGIIAVHHGGQVLDIPALEAIANEAGIWLVDDAAHAVGASLNGVPVGTLCRASCFSFGAVKNLTTGDGGMVTTNDEALARQIAVFRSLGLSQDTWSRYGQGSESAAGSRWMYDILAQGQRLHMNDIAASLGISQLQRMAELNHRRAELITRYNDRLGDIPGWRSVTCRAGTTPSWHMYTVLIDNRDAFVDYMRQQRIVVGVHYYPVHMLPIAEPYRTTLPVTERIWLQVCSMPMFPEMTDRQQDRVIQSSIEAMDTLSAE